MNEIAIGSSAHAQLLVTGADLASALRQSMHDDFPAVFATAKMIGLMELAASRVLQPLLKEGELSVGVSIEVTHDAPTPTGATVTATARFTGMNGKFYRFDISVSDAGGEVGRGTHQRAIVSSARLLAGAIKRTSMRE